MKHSQLKDLNKAIELIESGNTSEGVAMLHEISERENGYFEITEIHRDDLADRGFDTDQITDEQMSRLADKMGDDYCEQLFWSSMEILADAMNFPRL